MSTKKKDFTQTFYQLKALAAKFRLSNRSSNEEIFSSDYYFGFNASSLDDNSTMKPYFRGAADEEIFGVLLLICGLMAAIANAFILIIAVKHLRSRNVLFLIITNFALIDEFKALCAIYMACAQLISVAVVSRAGDQTSVYKMLQTSVFVFYFGNICSVLNLILAVTNEFLYIKLPLQYSKFVKKSRVVMAIVFIWLAGLAFSLSKALHGGSNDTGAQVWISHGSSGGSNDNFTRPPEVMNKSTFDRTISKGVYRRPNNTTSTDVYALILVSVLLCCLFVVGAVYLSLYRTIRRATSYRDDSVKSRVSIPADDSFKLNDCDLSCDEPKSPMQSEFKNKYNKKSRNSIKNKARMTKRRFLSRMSTESFFLTSASPRAPRQNEEERTYVPSAPPAPHMSPEAKLLTTTSPTPTRASNLKNMPSHCKHRRRDSRLFKRHKCVIVILSVCCLYLIYLSSYFSLQLFHIIHIVQGVEQTKLRERYIINFVLRALFVLHASLNPLIFFRIQTFRASFLRFVHCGKVGQTPMSRAGQSVGGGLSFADG